MAKKRFPVWFDDKLITAVQADRVVGTKAFVVHYGLGVFEGIKFYEQPDGSVAIFCLTEHVDRLIRSAASVGMGLRWSRTKIEDAITETVRASRLSTGYIRPHLFYGNCGLKHVPEESTPIHFAVEIEPWGKYAGNTLSLTLVKRRRLSSKAFDIQAKVAGHYVNSTMAAIEARACGYDDALMLDERGYVAEAPVANFFGVEGDLLWTPPSDSCLNGITRQVVIALARHFGIEVRERHFQPPKIGRFTGAFVTGTAVEIARVSGGRFGENRYMDWGIGAQPVIEKLQEGYVKLTTGRLGLGRFHLATC